MNSSTSLPVSSPPPTLATTDMVLPHDDTESNHLADRASHLTLSVIPGPSGPTVYHASSASRPHGSAPSSPGGRRRTCTACSAASDGPLSSQHSRQPCSSIGPRSPYRSTFGSASRSAPGAQSSPPMSQEPAREKMSMRDPKISSAKMELCHHMQPAGADTRWAAPESLFPGWNYGHRLAARDDGELTLAEFPNEVLVHVLGYLDVSDLLAVSRTSHQFRSLALAPIVHRYRLQHAREILPPLLTSPSRPSLTDLIHRSIFLTHTTVVSRKLARSLTAIRLSRRLAVRPPPEALVARSVLPPECVPGQAKVAPALVAKTRAVERELVKDGLRKWVGSVWESRWREKAEDRRRWEESRGVGRVWRLRRFWERVGRGEIEAN